jgi:hypothetical protein
LALFVCLARRAVLMISAPLTATRIARRNSMVLTLAGTTGATTSMVPDHAAPVCAVVHTCAGFEGASPAVLCRYRPQSWEDPLYHAAQTIPGRRGAAGV